MTDASQAIARLRELRAKATAGPWETVGWNDATSIEGADVFVCGRLALLDGGKHKKDAAAIVAAMNSLESLLACAEALEGMLFFVSELPGAQYSAYVTNASAALDALAKDAET